MFSYRSIISLSNNTRTLMMRYTSFPTKLMFCRCTERACVRMLVRFV